jgi:ribonucleotide monophosphatase NagD (HAD superfamily)
MPISSLVMVVTALYDIALGASSGITTVLVLSGETQLKDLAHSPYQPHMIFNHLGEMAVYIKKHCGIS